MALLDEEIVEEWLNRDGYFTIRGVKTGVDEMDILAIKPISTGLECLHVEVNVSKNPVGYMTDICPERQKSQNIRKGSAKHRSNEDLAKDVKYWITKKYRSIRKASIRNSLCSGAEWRFILVINKYNHEEEIILLRNEGIEVIHYSQVVSKFTVKNTPIPRASGSDLVDLILMNH